MSIFILSAPVTVSSGSPTTQFVLTDRIVIPGALTVKYNLSNSLEISSSLPNGLAILASTGSFIFQTGNLSYLSHPTKTRYNQRTLKTTNAELHTSDTSGFNIVKNSIFLKSVSSEEALSFRNFVMSVLQFTEEPFTIALNGNPWGDVDFGRGFEQNPFVDDCYLETTNTKDIFKFEEPGHYDIIIPYSFKE